MPTPQLMIVRPATVAPDRRARLSAAVAGLARAIAAGEISIDVVELQALAQICDDAELSYEAARVRGWIDGHR